HVWLYKIRNLLQVNLVSVTSLSCLNSYKCIVTIQMIVRTKSSKQVLVHEESNKFPKICTQNNGIHGPLITDNIRGEIFCGSCGFVLVDKVEDLGPEQHSFSLEQYNERSRTGIGSALSIDDKGLSTVIGSQDKDAAGNSISSSMKYTFN